MKACAIKGVKQFEIKEIKEAEIIEEDEDLEETLFRNKETNNPFEE